MINRLSRATRKRRRQQGGFTLIELLVVITILGILAAIVSVSLLGITSTARKNALLAEKQTVQTAFDAMLHDQHVDSTTLATVGGCDGTTYTQDMTHFPKNGVPYQAPDANFDGQVTVLSTHYLRQTRTSDAWYACDSDGNILQRESIRGTPTPSPS
ncbi:MAG: type II secretion system protein [Chloroflexi bacterium]|nr:MAG: type II secretion system protein [Chloroflexota bacterium]